MTTLYNPTTFLPSLQVIPPVPFAMEGKLESLNVTMPSYFSLAAARRLKSPSWNRYSKNVCVRAIAHMHMFTFTLTSRSIVLWLVPSALPTGPSSKSEDVLGFRSTSDYERRVVKLSISSIILCTIKSRVSNHDLIFLLVKLVVVSKTFLDLILIWRVRSLKYEVCTGIHPNETLSMHIGNGDYLPSIADEFICVPPKACILPAVPASIKTEQMLICLVDTRTRRTLVLQVVFGISLPAFLGDFLWEWE
ncbi:hypothetical protein C8Q75DRAFT_735043 [Abortiporus biennis]|nr:hypothetical protein C8Q75DRAFT_735043 [Abortiporus biennis]